MNSGFWLGVAAAAVVVGLSGYGLHSFTVNRMEAKHRATLYDQKLALTNRCEADKAITAKVSYGYQTKIAALDRKLADARRLRERSSCVAILAFTPARYDEAGKSGKPVRQGNEGAAPETIGYITYGSYVDLMGEGEGYRLQTESCQEFVGDVQGQNKNGRKKKR